MTTPEGIAVDGRGNVYVCDTSNSRVEKFDSTGNFTAQWGNQTTGNGQLRGPMGLALVSTGNYICVGSYGSAPITVFVNDTNIIPPFIVQQPTNQTVPAGTGIATLWVPASLARRFPISGVPIMSRFPVAHQRHLHAD